MHIPDMPAPMIATRGDLTDVVIGPLSERLISAFRILSSIAGDTSVGHPAQPIDGVHPSVASAGSKSAMTQITI
jgi:hypothetical protein